MDNCINAVFLASLTLLSMTNHGENKACTRPCAPSWSHPDSMVRRVYGVEGQSITLRCRVHCHPKPTILWYRDRNIINVTTLSGHASKYDTLRAKLTIHNISSHDRGRYMCKVSNPVGSLTWTYTLEVLPKGQKKPLIRHGYPFNISVVEGSATALECKVAGYENYDIQWSRSSGRATSNLKDVPVDGSSVMSTVQSLRRKEELGSMCTGSNTPDLQELSGYITRTIRFLGTIAPVRNSIISGDVSRHRGLGNGGREERITAEGDALVIKEVRPKDTGWYTCYVTSPDGTTHRSAYVDVISKASLRPSTQRRSQELKAVDNRLFHEDSDDPEVYLRGIVIAVGVSSVLVVGGMVGLLAVAIYKVTKRQDVVLARYDLK